MRSTKKAQSSACKVTRSDGKKTGGGGGGEKKVTVEEAEGSSVEQLLQQQEVSDQSITTVDEVVVKGPVVPQPSGGAGCPPFRFQLQPGGETGGGQLEQQQQVPPLQIYSPGSPPLPLAGPLHLVYLQPTPHGINVIPFQAVGCPTFTPSSPLGFPAHPNHPVVVQSPQLPATFPMAGQPQYQHHEIPPDFHQAFHHRSHPPPQGFYPGAGQNSTQPPDKKLFRPWEDQETKDVQAGLSNLKIT